MQHIGVFTCGGDSVVIAGGVAQEKESETANEIIKGDRLGVQAGFVKSLEIKIPKINASGDVFSADVMLCFAQILSQKNDAAQGAFTVSSDSLPMPCTVQYDAVHKQAKLSLASRAVIHLGAALPSVCFGGCEYYIADKALPENPQALLGALGEMSTCESYALLCLHRDSVEPYYHAGGTDSFSAGSAALALAFYESEADRDFIKKTYRFPKGERQVSIKRYLSEAFDATLGAQVTELGLEPQ